MHANLQTSLTQASNVAFSRVTPHLAGIPHHTKVACCESMPLCFAGRPVVSCTASKPAMRHALSLSRRVTQRERMSAPCLQGFGVGTILSARRWQRRTCQAWQQWLRGVSAGERRCCRTALRAICESEACLSRTRCTLICLGEAWGAVRDLTNLPASASVSKHSAYLVCFSIYAVLMCMYTIQGAARRRVHTAATT